ncbi:MAG: hypothetical protein RR749_15890 [Comamonas sp.]
MNSLFFPLIMLAAGLFFCFRNIRFLLNEHALREYMQNSPKAALWVKKYGLVGATKMARESFLPLGLVISVGMVAVSGWSLWRILA